MNLSRVVCFRLTGLLIFEISILTPAINSQFQGCSIEGIDLFQCLNQDNISSMDICCNSLNQIVRSGYNCLCSLMASSPLIAISSTPLSLPLSNCFISVPPLSLCQVLAPVPVVLPKENTTQTSASSQNVPVLVPVPVPVNPPPAEMHVQSNTSRSDNSTAVAAPSDSTENHVPQCLVLTRNGSANGTKILLHISLFLKSLAFIGCILIT